MSSVVERLAANNESFGQIAQQASEDGGSSSKYGSYLIDQDSKDEFINEFKFGIYAYDAFFDNHTANSAVSSEDRVKNLKTGLESSTKVFTLESELESVPKYAYVPAAIATHKITAIATIIIFLLFKSFTSPNIILYL